MRDHEYTEDELLIGRLMDEHLDAYVDAVLEGLGLEPPTDDLRFLNQDPELDRLAGAAARAMEALGDAIYAQLKHTKRASTRTRLANVDRGEACEVGPTYIRCAGRVYRRDGK